MYASHAIKLVQVFILSPLKLITVVQTHPLYHKPPIGTIHSAIWDLSSLYTLPPGIEPDSVDILILIFVMSALHPDEWGRAIANVHKVLYPSCGTVHTHVALEDAKTGWKGTFQRLWKT